MVLDIFDKTDHEVLASYSETRIGLNVIISIYSTALGPALGGVRFASYSTSEGAVGDVLRLSESVARANSLAGLALGGGASVVIGDPEVVKSKPLLAEYARVVESLGGRFVAMCDVGTTVADMDVVARYCGYVVGTSSERGGVGDPSPFTADGVYQGMLACAEYRWGTPSVAGRRVGIAGVGKVGRRLAELLVRAGASVVVTDVSDSAIETLVRSRPEIEVAVDTDAMIRSDIDIYAPCGFGGVLDTHGAAVLGADIVCGAADNQLAHESVAHDLHTRGVLYAPEFVVNAGGALYAAHELHGAGAAQVLSRVAGIFSTTKDMLEAADEQGCSPLQVARQCSDQRMRSSGRNREG